MLSIRKIGILGRTYRHLNRYRKILTVFIKYGYGDLVELLKIDQYIEIGLQVISKKRRERVEKLSRAERIRMALEELGPTYIKLGQALSTRPDLIPVDFIEELSKLQDDVPARPFDEIKATLEKELGGSVDEFFEFFDEKPIASASIGQVHKACLKDGETVAVKVQYAGIRKTIEVDLEIMLHLGTLMERNIEEAALHRPVKIVEEFAKTLEKEIDYLIEADNMDRFGRQFFDDPNIYVPKVFHDTTTERVLTMEFVEGIKVSELEKIESAGMDSKIINAHGANLFLKQVFDFGFFHADPHPGNIFVLPNHVICLLDFGMVCSVDSQTKELFVDLVDSVIHSDTVRATQILLKLTSWEEKPDLIVLEKEAAEFMGRYLYKPLKDIRLDKALRQLLMMASRHYMRVRPDIFLMMKAFATLEGVARILDPEFNMLEKAAPFIIQVKMARFYPQRIAGDVIRFTSEMLDFLQQLPRDILDITELIRRHKLSLRLEHQGLETMLAVLHQVSNRISFAIVIAALLISSALIVFAKTPPLFYGISIIGIVGFLTAAVLGIWLLFAVLRKGL